MLKLLNRITNKKALEVSGELHFDISSINRWINNKGIPSKKAHEPIIENLSEYYASYIETESQKNELLEQTENLGFDFRGTHKKVFVKKLIDRAYHNSRKEYLETRAKGVKGRLTGSYTGYADISSAMEILLKKHIVEGNDKNIIFTNLNNKGEFFDKIFSLLNKADGETVFNWVKHSNTAISKDDLFELYKYAIDTQYFNSNIYLTTQKEIPPFFYIKDKVVLIFSTNLQNNIIFLSYSEEGKILKSFDFICDRLFNHKYLIGTTTASSRFELDMTMGSFITEDCLYIHETFPQSFFLSEKLLKKLMKTNCLSFRDQEYALRLFRANRNLIENHKVTIRIFRTLLMRFLENRQIFLGKILYRIQEEDWNEMFLEMKKTMEINPDLEICFIRESASFTAIEKENVSMAIDGNNLWFKRNMVGMKGNVKNYLSIIDRPYIKELYLSIKNTEVLNWVNTLTPEEAYHNFLFENLEETIQTKFK